jgi:hypothetical protein
MWKWRGRTRHSARIVLPKLTLTLIEPRAKRRVLAQRAGVLGRPDAGEAGSERS